MKVLKKKNCGCNTSHKKKNIVVNVVGNLENIAIQRNIKKKNKEIMKK